MRGEHRSQGVGDEIALHRRIPIHRLIGEIDVIGDGRLILRGETPESNAGGIVGLEKSVNWNCLEEMIEIIGIMFALTVWCYN